MLADKNIELNWHVNENDVAYADRNMINTVLRNLISNAIKFIEKGQIDISVCNKNNHAWIEIKDTGVGIPKDTLKTIFEIGGAKSTKGTKGEPGTGLGLIICKEFVETNGGTIHVESTLNVGTSFRFSVPIKQP